MLNEKLDIAVNVLLELANRLGTESVRDSLALAGVLVTVTGIEETAANGDESVVEVAVNAC